LIPHPERLTEAKMNIDDISKRLKWGYTICFVLSPILFSVAFFAWSSAKSFERDALISVGEVVELVESESNDGATYHPRFKFLAFDGLEYVVDSDWGSSPPEFEVGDTVDVLYLEGFPEDAKIDVFFAVCGWSFIFGITAFGNILMGVILFAIYWMKNKSNNHVDTDS
jgi:hypothetical protein